MLVVSMSVAMPQRKVLARNVNVVRKIFVWLLVLGIGGALAAAQSSAPAGASPDWAATQDQLKLLDLEFCHPDYQIRLPPGYTGLALAPDDNMTTAKVRRQGFGWKGPAHETGGSPLLFVQSATLLKGPKKPLAPRDLVQSALARDLNHYKDVVSSRIEDGTLNGVACARVYWRGTLVNSQALDIAGPLAHGFIYVTWNPRKRSVIWIECEDVDPYYATTSKELEAAALTLKPD